MRNLSVVALLCAAIFVGNCFADVLIFDTHATSACDTAVTPRQSVKTCAPGGEGCLTVGDYNFVVNRSLCGEANLPAPRSGFLAATIYSGGGCPSNTVFAALYEVPQASSGQNITINGFSFESFNPSPQTIIMSCDANAGILSGQLCYPSKCTSFSLSYGVCSNFTTMSTDPFFSGFQNTCGSAVTAPMAATPVAGTTPSSPASPVASAPKAAPVAAPGAKKSSANKVIASVSTLALALMLF